MARLEFRTIGIEDRERAREILKLTGFRGCEYTFGNNLLWKEVYDCEVCFFGGLYIIKQKVNGLERFLYPAGNESAEYIIELLSEYCREKNIPLYISANKEKTEKLKALFPNAEIRLNRGFCDYVYNASDLENLSGRKYHSKRNHLSRFYENDWSFEEISAENISECNELLNLCK